MFVAGVFEAELSVAVVIAHCTGSVKAMRLMRSVLPSVLTLLLLQFCFFVGVLSL